MSKEMVLNYANDDHFNMVLERFGGEDYLKKNFPCILQVIYNTREWHNSKGNELQNENEEGYVDTFRIIELPTPVINDTKSEIKTDVYANSFMSMVKIHPYLCMSSDISDPIHGKIFGGYAAYVDTAAKFSKNLTINSSYLNYCKEPTVKTTTNFQAYDKVDGKDVITVDTSKDYEIDIMDFNKIVTNILVNAPCPKTDSATYIRVVYNGRTDDDAAYNFKKATDRYISDTRYVTVYYPFSIKIILDELFEFNPQAPVNFDSTFNLSIASDVILGGEVHFNTALSSRIVATVQDNVLTFDFPYSSDTDYNYWGVEMPLTAKQAEGYFDFHLNFVANYRIKGSGTYTKTSIIISSEDLPESDNYKHIKKSRILWGCLGKNTLIKTENGYKIISEIKTGEKIFTDKGYIALKNMVTGIEEKIIAVGVSEEKTLLITKNHPILTDRGVIPAIDLAATDKLKLEDGTFKDIYYLEVLEYNDKVYSPELEESALISADGIMVGDYLTPVSEVNETSVEPQSLEPELVEELKRWVTLKNEQIQKEVNV
jgi:hypothetical protein